MRIFSLLVLVVLLVIVGTSVWVATRKPTDEEAKRIAHVLDDPAPSAEPPAYAHCASCHLHDGSGRPDGSIPRLNGQRSTVLQSKLFRLRAGTLRIPVMDAFARSLAPKEVEQVARYLSALPETSQGLVELTAAERSAASSLYIEHCASCHGANAEGNDGLFASRLCGQYQGYLERRLEEVRLRTRGDADAVMQDVLDQVPEQALGSIVKWLAAGGGCSP